MKHKKILSRSLSFFFFIGFISILTAYSTKATPPHDGEKKVQVVKKVRHYDTRRGMWYFENDTSTEESGRNPSKAKQFCQALLKLLGIQ